MVTSTADRGAARRLFPVLVIVSVAAPFVVVLVATIGERWYPGSDIALEILRIADVGGRHTPLTGVISRFGWDHPGPLLFYVLAPFHWVGGVRGVLLGVLLVNLAAALGVCWAARRRGGDAALLVFAVAILVLVRAAGAGRLVDPWNPWVAVLPFFAFLALMWCVAERDLVVLPAAVLVGSFVVQAHVGYAPLVVVLGAAALALTALRRSDETGGFGPARRSVGVAVGLGVLAWLPPIVDQLAGDGNLGDIAGWFRRPGEARLGLADAFGVMGRELPLTWIHGNEVRATGFLRGIVLPASTLPALAFMAVAGIAAFVAWRRGGADATRLTLLVAAGTVVGVGATSRITGLIAPYLFRWWWVLGAAWWCALVWSLWSAVGRPFPDRVRIGAAVGVGILAVAVGLGATSARSPQPEISEAVAALIGPTAAAIRDGESAVVRCTGAGDLDATCLALLLALRDRGRDAYFPPSRAREVGVRRTRPASRADTVVTVLTSDDRAERGVTLPTGARRLVTYELATGLGFVVWATPATPAP
ncbi:MAG: hypothetical protein ACKO1Y_00940 [Actinomycetota bacterium]